MPKAVQFESYGESDVLQVVEVDLPEPAAGEVRVAVVAAGINPGEAAIRRGYMDDTFPAHFPEGQGSDFAGVVDAVGDGVDSVDVGDPVIGFSDDRNSQAEFVVVPADRVISKPDSLSWDEAGALYVAGTTAAACVFTVGVKPGDTVVVAGAAGGVGTVTAQIAQHAGARVIATVSEDNEGFFHELDIETVRYGDGMVERIRQLAPDGVSAFIDAHGHGNVAAAVELGVPLERINTIIDWDAAEQFGVKAKGMSTVDPREVLTELAARMARGEISLPVYARFPLAEVRAAYDRLAQGHGLGKIVLEVHPAP
jgi:NADPH:quinone reductase-like Zn-dependent oxidoreductase